MPVIAAIASHESPGHDHQSETVSELFIRLAAALAYEALWEIMRTGSMKHWFELQRLNDFIHELSSNVAFLWELFATVVGFYQKERVCLPSGKWLGWPKLEQECVDFQAHTEDLGEEFAEFYWKLRAICEVFGTAPLHYLEMYAGDCVSFRAAELAELQQRVLATGAGQAEIDFSILTRMNRISRVEIMQRLQEGIRLLNVVMDSQIRPEGDEHAWWPRLFLRYIPKYEKYLNEAGMAWLGITAALTASSERLSGRGLRGFNPVKVRQLMHEEHWAFDTLSALDEADAQRLYPKRDPMSVVSIDELLSMDIDTDININVAIAPRQGNQVKPGLSFVHLVVHDTGEIRLVPYVAGLGAGLSDSAGEDSELQVAKAGVRRHVGALVFFETLRVMAASGYGLQCPLRDIPWALGHSDQSLGDTSKSRRCSFTEPLIRLWKAGRDGGLSSDFWREPSACVGCSGVTGLGEIEDVAEVR